MALEQAGAYAEGSDVCGRSYDGGVGAVGFFVDDVDGAGVVEVDEDSWDVGVVVDGDGFVWSVVDFDDAEGLVGEDRAVVGREGVFEEEEEWDYAGEHGGSLMGGVVREESQRASRSAQAQNAFFKIAI